MEFWTKAQMASIHKMINPRSIAVVGATPRLQYGGRFLVSALEAKDRVRVYPVNPRYDEINGVKSYASVMDLPEAPDVVGVVVPHDQVLDVLKESHAKGAGSAVVISAGFAERGGNERRDLQGELGAFARDSGLRISGPNCLGLVNLKDNIWVTSSSRRAAGLTGSIGLVCQSGATAFGPFLARAVENGIGFSHIISTGNEADLDFADFARYLLDDPATSVIAGFVEGFKHAEKFIEVAKLAAERSKPIVLIKIGRSELGAKAARSHTAALTGADARYDAIFSQYGVIRVQDYDELLEVANLFALAPKPDVPGIAVVSHSGGISSLTADMCGQAGLDLPPLGDMARNGINAILKGFGWASNPADVTGFANKEAFPQILKHMIDDPQVGTLVVASGGADAQAQEVINRRDQTKKSVVFLWTGGRDAKNGLPLLKKAGIPIFYKPDGLARGLQRRLAYHTWREHRLQDGFAAAPARTPQQDEAISRALDLGQQTLSESQGKQLLAAWGVQSAREYITESEKAAVEAGEQLGFPVAIKVDSPDILHKTETGVVRLNLCDVAQVRAAHAEVLANAKTHSPQARIVGVSVQEMVRDGVEVIVGVSYDPQLGPMLLFGSGGVMVEVYNDVSLRHCPITHSEAQSMIAEVKGSRLLQGFRGKPAADVEALADTLVQISHLAIQFEGKLEELDINPLMVLPAGKGVRAVDALLVFRDATSGR